MIVTHVLRAPQQASSNIAGEAEQTVVRRSEQRSKKYLALSDNALIEEQRVRRAVSVEQPGAPFLLLQLVR